MKSSCFAAILAVGASLFASSAFAADTCGYRGQLDEAYCDADHDLVADVPGENA